MMIKQVPDVLYVLYSEKEESLVYAFGPNVQQCWESGILIMFNIEKGFGLTDNDDRWERRKKELQKRGYRARRAKVSVEIPDRAS